MKARKGLRKRQAMIGKGSEKYRSNTIAAAGKHIQIYRCINTHIVVAFAIVKISPQNSFLSGYAE